LLRERKTGMCMLAKQLVVLLASMLVASTALAATELAPGASEFKVEMPRELRMLAGRGQLSPVTHALVTVAVPPSFDATRDWPVLAVSATSDVEYRSSRAHLRAYAGRERTGHGLHLADSPGAQNTQAGSRRHSQRKAVTSSASTSRGSTRIRFWRRRASSIC